MLQRLKFDIASLVNQMLDQLPQEVWKSSTTTFLDPAIGGGQFVFEIEKRLRSHGHSDENIRDRVWGFSDSTLAILYSVNKHRLIGNYHQVSYNFDKNFVTHNYNKNGMRHDFQMKFDVVVGNPPYNKGKMSSASGSGNSIWEKFLPSLWNFISDNGYVCFVHPPEWRTNRYSSRKRKASDLMFNHQIIWLKAAFPFPGAGCTVDAYVLQKTQISRKTEWQNYDGSIYHLNIDPIADMLLNHQDEMTNKILKKLLIAQNDNVFCRKAMGGLVILDKKLTGSFELVKGAKFARKISSHPHIHQNKLKVIMSDNRDFRPFIDEGKLGIEDHVHYAIFEDIAAAEWFVELVNSRLSRFLQWAFCEGYDAANGKHGHEAWNSAIPFKMLRLSDERIEGNVDEYFYKFYSLSSREIDYIEKRVK